MTAFGQDIVYRIAIQSFDKVDAEIKEVALEAEDRMRRLGWPEDAAARAGDQVHKCLLKWCYQEATR